MASKTIAKWEKMRHVLFTFPFLLQNKSLLELSDSEEADERFESQSTVNFV